MYYTILCIGIRGVISMIHPHNLMNMSIAPPPEWTSNSPIKFEEGVIKHSPSKKESASYV